MGASLGAALKARGFTGRIQAYARRETTRNQALERGLADAVFDQAADAVRGADVVVCCVPILSIPSLIMSCRDGLEAGCVVTDVGSTKLDLARTAAEALAGTGACFVGSHPIAGSEQQGLEAAAADLYEGATVVVTPEDRQADGLAPVEALWTFVGARVVIMESARHDRYLARTSHLPHLVASALARTVGRGDDADQIGDFCGTGFRDTTRVAAGSPDVWLDIVRTNKVEVTRELHAFLREVEDLVRRLDADDFKAVYAYLERSKVLRETLAGASGDTT